MSAADVDEIRNVVLLFTNPSWYGVGTVSNTVIRNITSVSGQIAYSSRIKDNITVLAAKQPLSFSGLLYVPDLEQDDPCVNQTAPYVPENAVRRANLPPANMHVIAIAPWVSSTCSKKYMASASRDPLQGLIFFRPHSHPEEPPPAAASPSWDINGSTRWRSQNLFPVLAVSGLVGRELVYQLSLYSGNLTQVPFSRNITDFYHPDPEDYVRIWSEIILVPPTSFFGIWVYFLIVIAVLLVIISATSVLMHLTQARRRALLRRRVISGEVNLEAMGIKRLTVPRNEIKDFPLYTYCYEPTSPSPPASPGSPASPRSIKSKPHSRTNSKDQSTARRSSEGTTKTTALPATNYQPQCSICLEAFENRVTVIREIRCGHIFHPECIDAFLGEVSSLCPVCKAGMLPQGYSPNITNAMVRRERALRRLRHNGVVEEGRLTADVKSTSRTPIFDSIFRKRGADENSTSEHPAGGELKSSSPTAAGNQLVAARMPQGPNALTRGVARSDITSTLEAEEADGQLTRWQRIRMNVFPGFS